MIIKPQPELRVLSVLSVLTKNNDGNSNPLPQLLVILIQYFTAESCLRCGPNCFEFGRLLIQHLLRLNEDVLVVVTVPLF